LVTDFVNFGQVKKSKERAKGTCGESSGREDETLLADLWVRVTGGDGAGAWRRRIRVVGVGVEGLVKDGELLETGVFVRMTLQELVVGEVIVRLAAVAFGTEVFVTGDKGSN
jgi:hypothetical protein